MAEIDANKIKVSGFERVQLPDGSARFLRYKTDENKKDLLTLKPLYGTNFQLEVNLPSQRNIDAVINIVKSSANCYKLTYSDSKRTDMQTFKNYDGINDYLFNLNQLKIDLPKSQKK